MPIRPWSRLLAAGVAITTVTLPALPSANAEVDAPPSSQPISATPAERALTVAEAVMSGRSDALSPTLALRDLALQLDRLDGAQRAAAEALLARPNKGGDGFATWTTREARASRHGKGCSTDPATPICVHWTNGGGSAPDPQDRDHDGVPNWVETTLTEMEHVWSYEVDTLRFRAPMTDQRGSSDNDGVYFDVYLSDIGSRYYGYCAVDDTHNRRNYDFKDRSGYCVLDDDYRPGQFPTHTPRQNLQVTAAHEFFHAIQFAYDASEDLWFMEGGAAWIEDEVYTQVNDNRQYLALSQFRHPARPLDDNRGLGVYGSWGFLRFLSDEYGPDVILRAWKRADGSPGGPDRYSLVALRQAVDSLGGDFQTELGNFGVAVHTPAAFLDEGEHFPSATTDTFRLDRTHDSTGWQRYSLDHLAYAPIALRRGDHLGGAATVRISVDVPNRSAHPEVRAMRVFDNGSVGPLGTVSLDRRGRGSITVGVLDPGVKEVVLSLANTSTDFRRCFSRTTPYSCHGGIPTDDDGVYWFRARLH